ncbi:hypothetical protein GOD94_17155 [Sinorhizobium medicae]|nr:hypothetical protein [Sinorhizobium medicae]MDX0874629.1 hypothetical protein [Sinorhizobium medicae]
MRNGCHERLNQISHEHTARLPFGYTVTFVLRGGRFECRWLPDVPRKTAIRRRAFNRLKRVYDRERNAFLEDLATMAGGTIGVVETHDLSLAVVRPGTRQ